MLAFGLWDASLAALWVLVLVNTIVLVALVRQVGVVLLRVGQVVAPRSSSGPSPGDVLAIPELSRLGSNPLRGAFDRIADDGEHRPRVLVFLSPDCGLCHEMVPAANAVAVTYRSRFEVIQVVDLDQDSLLQWVAETKSRTSVIAVPGVLKNYDIPGTPFACIVGDGDVIMASGWVNHLEHLEALIRSCPSQGKVGASSDRPPNPDEKTRAGTAVGRGRD